MIFRYSRPRRGVIAALGDDTDLVVAKHARRGFFKPPTFRIGERGPIRSGQPLYCEVVASEEGLRLRPAPGRAINAGSKPLAAETAPSMGTKYRTDDGLTFWFSIG